IAQGTRIFEGSTISFVLGSGLGDDENEVPDLEGMTYSEGRILLQSLGLNVGAIMAGPNVKDTANAYIYRQNPTPVTLLPDGKKQVNKIRVGQSLDVWLSKEPVEKIEVLPEDGSENNE
ncbi:MAG TPA: PASTA domain-containing protein, partial [Phnomibacter sp.]|nr:PASTA domain-containing protein [Phnomibacter sp.]